MKIFTKTVGKKVIRARDSEDKERFDKIVDKVYKENKNIFKRLAEL